MGTYSIGELLPDARFPDAVVRRTVAAKMFAAVHIAPSHRRPPHPVWVDSFSLIADLLFGNGVGRYVGAMQRPAFPQEVAVRGFSAGSFSGLAFLHILWPIPGVTTKGWLGAIACPPSMLGMSQAKADDRLHLIHYESAVVPSRLLRYTIPSGHWARCFSSTKERRTRTQIALLTGLVPASWNTC